jgi:hypothetical protein
MRTFPLFNFTTFLMRGVAMLIPSLEYKLKEISTLFNFTDNKHNAIKK